MNSEDAIRKATAGACIDIARKVQQARLLAGDISGSSAAGQVALLIQQDVLEDRITPEPDGSED